MLAIAPSKKTERIDKTLSLIPKTAEELKEIDRMKNRLAAQKCRERKRDRDNALQARAAELKEQNGQVEQDIFHLRETRLKLREGNGGQFLHFSTSKDYRLFKEILTPVERHYKSMKTQSANLDLNLSAV